MYERNSVTNVQSAFKCTEKCDGKKIIAFSTIFNTTGNTAQSCARELANNGAEQICALTLAIHVQIKLPINCVLKTKISVKNRYILHQERKDFL